MIRSFVVTIGFSISRLLEDMIVHTNAEVSRVDRLTVLSWVSWIVPLIVTEWILIRNRKINKSYNNIAFAVNTAKDEPQTIQI